MSCTNFTVSKLSKFCFKCDPRLSLVSKNKTRLINNNEKKNISRRAIPIAIQKQLEKKDDYNINHNVVTTNLLTKDIKINKKKNNYEKLFCQIGKPGH